MPRRSEYEDALKVPRHLQIFSLQQMIHLQVLMKDHILSSLFSKLHSLYKFKSHNLILYICLYYIYIVYIKNLPDILS